RFPIFYERKKALRVIANVIERRRQQLELERQEAARRAAERKTLGGIYADPLMSVHQIPEIPNMALSANLTKERDAIDQVVRDARHQIRLVKGFLDSARGNPESSPQITFALVLVTILFYAGVIYPLSFMPLPQNAEI